MSIKVRQTWKFGQDFLWPALPLRQNGVVAKDFC
jgi:hypothetical protein